VLARLGFGNRLHLVYVPQQHAMTHRLLTLGGFVRPLLYFGITWLGAFFACMIFLIAYEDTLRRSPDKTDRAKSDVMFKCAAIAGLLLAVIWIVRTGFE
jgi:hypothetical protein